MYRFFWGSVYYYNEHYCNINEAIHEINDTTGIDEFPTYNQSLDVYLFIKLVLVRKN